jgi:hypothetical protein
MIFQGKCAKPAQAKTGPSPHPASQTKRKLLGPYFKLNDTLAKCKGFFPAYGSKPRTTQGIALASTSPTTGTNHAQKKKLFALAF